MFRFLDGEIMRFKDFYTKDFRYKIVKRQRQDFIPRKWLKLINNEGGSVKKKDISLF